MVGRRIEGRGEAVLVARIPAAELRLDTADRIADAEVEAVGRLGNRAHAIVVGQIVRIVQRIGAGDRQALRIVGEGREGRAEVVGETDIRRSEERRGGEECGSPCRSRWAAYQ